MPRTEYFPRFIAHVRIRFEETAIGTATGVLEEDTKRKKTVCGTWWVDFAIYRKRNANAHFTDK